MDARRSIDPAMQARLESGVLAPAFLVKVTRQNGVVMGFTTHDEDLVYGGVTYEALSGITASALRTTLGTGIDNMEVMGALTSDSITEDDLLGERYDNAEVETLMLDWAVPGVPPVLLSVGWIGRVTLRQGAFSAEVVTLSQVLDQQVHRLCSAECSAVAQLGQAPCFANLMGKVFEVSGLSGSTREVVRVGGTGISGQGAGFYEQGRLRCLDGANAGIAREIKSSIDSASNVHVTLSEPFPFEPQEGDAYELRVGCDGRFATCHSRFGNTDNFQGFPHLPGTLKTLRPGRAR